MCTSFPWHLLVCEYHLTLLLSFKKVSRIKRNVTKETQLLFFSSCFLFLLKHTQRQLYENLRKVTYKIRVWCLKLNFKVFFFFLNDSYYRRSSNKIFADFVWMICKNVWKNMTIYELMMTRASNKNLIYEFFSKYFYLNKNLM